MPSRFTNPGMISAVTAPSPLYVANSTPTQLAPASYPGEPACVALKCSLATAGVV
jgi:hypothetical protein